jgi:pseudouridine synthase
VASRRRAEELIRAGRVRVDGRTAELGEQVDAGNCEIRVDGVAVAREPLRYWLLNKPRGVLSTCHDPEGRRTVLELLPAAARTERLFPVGRLDLDSEGLLLLTNDGEIAQVLLHPSLGTIRTYEVLVSGVFGDREARAMAEGIPLEEGRTAPARILSARSEARGVRILLELGEGRKRQIRRSMQALGCRVIRLRRTAMGPLRLGSLPVGSARPLSGAERAALEGHARSARSSVT